MMRSLRQRETAHLAEMLSRQLNAIHVPHEPGSRISGVYERAIATPTSKLAVIRSADTFTLAPWKPALEPLRGRAVLDLVGPNRVMCTLDRGRTLPGAGGDGKAEDGPSTAPLAAPESDARAFAVFGQRRLYFSRLRTSGRCPEAGNTSASPQQCWIVP